MFWLLRDFHCFWTVLVIRGQSVTQESIGREVPKLPSLGSRTEKVKFPGRDNSSLSVEGFTVLLGFFVSITKRSIGFDARIGC